jgi:hypothetical protein
MRPLRFASAAAALLCAALLNGSAAAEGAPPPLVSDERLGYAFEFPRVLAEQRLFGIAHGVSLLASACLDVPASADAAADAYTLWYDQQQKLIETVQQELAVFYYGERAQEASWSHLATALNLRQRLTLAPDSQQLSAACATLPQALQQTRYDLQSRFKLEAALAAVTLHTRIETWVAACLPRLPEKARAELSARHAEWQHAESVDQLAAQAQMLAYWQSTATPGEPDAWLKALTERYAKPGESQCTQLAASLQQPTSRLAQSFVAAPLIGPKTLPVSAAATGSVNAQHGVHAVSHSTPDLAPVVLPVETHAGPPPEPSPETSIPASTTEQTSPPTNAVTHSAETPLLLADPAAPATPAAVASSEAAPATDSEEAQPEAATPNLFDYLMRLFDERPYEEQATPTDGKPGRSPRAHP